MATREEIREDNCPSLVDDVCKEGFQACALTMFRSNCRNRGTLQPDNILSRQEEIREGLNSKLWILSRVKKVEQKHIDGFIGEILELEDRLGVVIEVDRERPELPQHLKNCHYPEAPGLYHMGQDSVFKAGYVAVEPLIEGGQDAR